MMLRFASFEERTENQNVKFSDSVLQVYFQIWERIIDLSPGPMLLSLVLGAEYPAKNNSKKLVHMYFVHVYAEMSSQPYCKRAST